MPSLAPALADSRGLPAVAMAGVCAGLVLGGALALCAQHGVVQPPPAAVRQAFEATAPALRPRSTPSFSWAFLLPRPRLRLATAGRDLECLTDAVYYEARGEPVRGQEAVAQVVLNRTRKPGFPKSVCAVVFQRAGRACQFSFACDGSVTTRREAGAWARARQVASQALGGYEMAEIGGATHFHVAGLQAGWGGRLLQVAQIGAHVFYGFGRSHPASVRGAAPADLTPAVLTLPAAPSAAVPAASSAPASAPAATPSA